MGSGDFRLWVGRAESDINSKIQTTIDCIDGDISYSNAVTVFNDGTPDSAHMYAQDTTYPMNNIPIDLTYYPGFYYEDINFDGKKDLIIYRITTGLFSLMLLAGAITYFVQYEMVSDMFISLGVPTKIIYPLAILKILGIIAIWFIKSHLIKQLAYLGFALDLGMAIVSHLNADDGGFFGPLVPLILLIIGIALRKKNKHARC